MSGRQRESHHLLHLTGASTNTSHQFFSDRTGPQFGASHSHAFSVADRAAAGTERRVPPSPRRKSAHTCGDFCIIIKCHRILDELLGPASDRSGHHRPQHLLKTTREGSDPRQASLRNSPPPSSRRLHPALPPIDKCICNRTVGLAGQLIPHLVDHFRRPTCQDKEDSA